MTFARNHRCFVLTTLVPILISILAPSADAEEGSPLTALLIVDIQEFYFPDGAMPLVAPEAAAANAGRLLERFRTDGLPVIHVGHNASSGSAFHADVMPHEGEKVVMKDEVSAFNGTDLLPYLKETGVEKLVICGMQTHMCLEAATRSAHDLGFEVVVIGDACATRDVSYGEVTVTAADVHASTLATLDRVYARVDDTDGYLGD